MAFVFISLAQLYRAEVSNFERISYFFDVKVCKCLSLL